MKKLRLIFFIFIIIAGLFPPYASAYSSETPKRIISLAPNMTEILFALGLGDRIAGVTTFCDYPREAKLKPKVGGMSNPSLETVVSMKPDIVMMTTDGNPKEFEERLRSLHIRTYVFRARKLSELPQGIREMGTALGVTKKAEILAAEIETAVNKATLFRLNQSSKKKVLFIIWPEPLIVAGPGTEINDAINLLGVENTASKARARYPKYSIEEIIRQSPDVIFIGKGHEDIKEMSEVLLKKIARTPAVRNGKVFFLSDSLYRLGPRVVKGIEEMSGCLR
jgi:iron complex transport system substrate-binding protein